MEKKTKHYLYDVCSTEYEVEVIGIEIKPKKIVVTIGNDGYIKEIDIEFRDGKRLTYQ